MSISADSVEKADEISESLLDLVANKKKNAKKIKEWGRESGKIYRIM